MPVEDNGPKLVATLWALTVTAALVLCLRFYCKLKLAKGLWWDDYVMTFGWLCLLVDAIIYTIAMTKGFGKHLADIHPANLSEIFKITNAGALFSIISVAISKTSFALTLIRLCDGWLRGLLWCIIASLNIIMFLNALFLYVRCSPIAAAWNFTIHGKCWEFHVLMYFTIAAAAFSGAMDFFFALIPWILLWNHKMKKAEKFGVAVAMSMGILAGVTAIVKCAYIPTMTRRDYTFHAVYPTICGVTENAVTIIAASIPFLRVLLKDVSTRYTGSQAKNSQRQSANSWATEDTRNETVFSANSEVAKGTASGLPGTQDDRSDRSILDSRGLSKGTVESHVSRGKAAESV